MSSTHRLWLAVHSRVRTSAGRVGRLGEGEPKKRRPRVDIVSALRASWERLPLVLYAYMLIWLAVAKQRRGFHHFAPPACSPPPCSCKGRAKAVCGAICPPWLPHHESLLRRLALFEESAECAGTELIRMVGWPELAGTSGGHGPAGHPVRGPLWHLVSRMQPRAAPSGRPEPRSGSTGARRSSAPTTSLVPVVAITRARRRA